MKKNRMTALLAAGMLCLALVACGSAAGSDKGAAATNTNAEASTEAATQNATEADTTQAEADAVSEGQEEVPQRVVALGESNAELWLLSGGTLVGVSEDALDLEGLPSDIASVGELEKPSVESIVALEPDLLICFSSSPAQKAAGERIQEMGIKVLFTNIDNFGDYADVMKQMTDVLGREDLYKTNVEDVQAGIDAVLAQVEPVDPTPSYLILHVSATKSKVEKNDYFAAEILNNLGLTNIISDDSDMDEINLEAVVKEDPDYIFVIPRGSDKKAKAAFEDQFENDPAWSELKASKDGHVYVLPKDLFGLKPNAQWADAYQYAYDVIYGEGSRE